MIPVSVVIPVKNEEKNLPHCLERLKAFSEILIVDSGSVDDTKDIAHNHNVQVVDFKWNGCFPKKRNWVLRNFPLKNNWVLFLDADEYVSEEFVEEVRRVVSQGVANGYWITYHNHFMGQILRHGDTMRKLALFRKDKGEYEKIEEDSWSLLDMEVHEHPIVEGNVCKIGEPVEHHDYKGYEAYINRHNAYSTWEARRYLALQEIGYGALTIRQRVKYKLINSWLLGPIYFLGAYFLMLGLFDGKAGLLFAINKMIYFLQIKIKIDEFKQKEFGFTDKT